MAKKFIFIKDVENLLKQGQSEVQLPEGSRFSPAAWDLIRDKNIKVTFTSPSSSPDDEMENRQSRPSSSRAVTAAPGLAAVASESREPSGTVGRFTQPNSYFLIFDFKGRFIDIIKNPYGDESEDINKRVADLLASSQVSVFVAGQFNQNIKDELTDKKIQYFEMTGPIEEAVKIIFNKKGGDKRAPNDNINSTNTD